MAASKGLWKVKKMSKRYTGAGLTASQYLEATKTMSAIDMKSFLQLLAIKVDDPRYPEKRAHFVATWLNNHPEVYTSWG